jgi:hypothetical protein
VSAASASESRKPEPARKNLISEFEREIREFHNPAAAGLRYPIAPLSHFGANVAIDTPTFFYRHSLQDQRVARPVGATSEATRYSKNTEFYPCV